MIELKNVCKIYNSSGVQTQALNNINLTIDNKGLVFIVGKSGSGKTTLLNLLGGIDCVTSGKIIFNNKDITNFNETEYDLYRNSCIGFIFQDFNLLEEYNVYENIEISKKLQNDKCDKNELKKLLAYLGLDFLETRKINELSGGQKQRVAIARALIKHPKVILADEPTGNLDRKTSVQIFEILKEISKDNLVIVISHDMESAIKYSDRIIEIEDGKVINDSNINIVKNMGIVQFKKSKIPLLYTLKMSIKEISKRPFKTLMTIILTTMSLVFMAILVNFSLFDKETLVYNTMKDNNDFIYNIDKRKYDSSYTDEIPLSSEDILNIENIINTEYNLSYNLYNNGKNLEFEFGERNEIKELEFYIHTPSQFNFIEVVDDNLLKNVIGRIPDESNEIVVHKYFCDYIIKYGIKLYNDEIYYPKNYEEILNDKKEIKLADNKVVIVGIIDDDDSIYQELKNGVYDKKLFEYFYENYALKSNDVYVKGFVNNAKLNTNKYSILDNASIFGLLQSKGTGNVKILEENIEVVTKDKIYDVNYIEKDLIVVSFDTLMEFNEEFENGFYNYLKQNNYISFSDAQKEYAFKYLQDNSMKFYLYFNSKDSTLKDEKNLIAMYGITLGNYNYISSDYFNTFKPIQKEINSVRVYDNNKKNVIKSLKSLMNVYSYSSELGYERGIHYGYTFNNSSYIATVIYAFEYFNIYIIIIALVFILFTFLLFSNFITTSISNSKKQIGILKAMGSKNSDVAKIFMFESLYIAIISSLFAIIIWYCICRILNKLIFKGLFFKFNGILIKSNIPLIVVIFTIVIAILISFMYVKRITKIKPIDVIYEK